MSLRDFLKNNALGRSKRSIREANKMNNVKAVDC